VRFVVDINWADDDQVEGTIAWAGSDVRRPVVFSGLLELFASIARQGRERLGGLIGS